MEPQSPQTSFIPKQTLQKGAARKKKRGGGVFLLLSIFIFLIAAGAGVGVYLYERLLEGSIANKEASLERAREAFEPELIEEFARLDERITAAAEVLENHKAPSVLLRELERFTLQTVRFSSFTYRAGGAEAAAMLSMRGEAESFGSVALQSDVFARSDIMTEPVFSNLNLDASGNVAFDFETTIAEAELAYTENLNRNTFAPVGNTPATTTPATTTPSDSEPQS